ncbi:hypothetical protein ABPG74_007718 [Tetrahymena malaccensis]
MCDNKKQFYDLDSFFKSDFLESDKLVLYFNQKSIDSSKAAKLGTVISKYQNLKTLVLWLNYNNISKGVAALGKRLENCTNLTKLKIYLRCNLIFDQGISQLGKCLEGSPNLTDLKIYLEHNKFGSKGFSLFSESLKKCSNLINLEMDIQGNKINNGLLNLAASLENCHNLTSFKLNIGQCYVCEEVEDTMYDFAVQLGKCKSIQILKLDLQSNSIRKSGYEGLAIMFKSLMNVHTLDLNLLANLEGNSCISQFIPAFNYCINLKHLKLNIRLLSVEYQQQMKLQHSCSKIKRLVINEVDF